MTFVVTRLEERDEISLPPAARAARPCRVANTPAGYLPSQVEGAFLQLVCAYLKHSERAALSRRRTVKMVFVHVWVSLSFQAVEIINSFSEAKKHVFRLRFIDTTCVIRCHDHSQYLEIVLYSPGHPKQARVSEMDPPSE
jgi:hypothetical protein